MCRRLGEREVNISKDKQEAKQKSPHGGAPDKRATINTKRGKGRGGRGGGRGEGEWEEKGVGRGGEGEGGGGV